MLPSMQKCGQNFESHLLKLSQKDEEIDLKALSGDFTLDAIFAGVFGIENDNFNNPDNIFRRMALRMVGAEGYAARSTFATMINILLINTVPWLANDILKLDVMPSDALEFFADIVRKTYQQRLLSGESRNDLIDLLIEEMRTAKEKGTDEGLDFETMLVSNCVLFFSSGFSTSSDGISVVVHRLAINPEEQDKIYDEINEEIGDEEITLERLQNLKYTEKFIQEALRCANLLSGLERECTKNYKIPGTDAVVKKGQTVVVYTPSIQFSEDNFVNAKEFDPENFDQSNLKNKFAHLAFGQGPRNCIGMRFGMFMMKLGIIFLVRKFHLHRGATMKDKLVYNMGITDFEGGVKVKLERR